MSEKVKVEAQDEIGSASFQTSPFASTLTLNLGFEHATV